MRRRASGLFLLAAILWWGSLSALAIRPDFQETRVGGCDPPASGQTSATASQTVENAMGCGGCGYETASGQANWLNRDPIGERGGINLYQAMGNNPVNNVDPYGLWIWFGWFRSQPSQPAPYDPNSYKAMRDSMIGDPSDYDFNGKTAGQVTQDIGMAVPKGIAQAAMMIPFGPEEEAVAAAEEAAAAAKAARAAAKCEKASEKAAKAMARQIAKDLGKDAQRAFHDAKEPGSGDRTMEQLKTDAQALYEEYGVPIPKWMQSP